MISMIKKIKTSIRLFWIVVLVGMMMTSFAKLSLASSAQKMFSSSQEAVEAAVAAVRANDEKEFLAIFGPEGKGLFSSGDAVSDKQGRERFLKAYDEKSSLVVEGENMVLLIGAEDWPFPVPLVKNKESWVFDTLAGKDEILNRRIGRNELDAIQVCLAIVDAQREYAMKDRDANGTPDYAEKFQSDPRQKNGLYWEAKDGELPSPLGPGVAKAKEEGYSKSGDAPIPFHGYFYRILKAQGKDALGGAYDYVVKGKMIGGFAVVAYPAQYGNSGVMTFIVNHDGVVYQKDLGDSTPRLAKNMKTFNPDESWTKAGD
jgi:hypothetical protein